MYSGGPKTKFHQPLFLALSRQRVAIATVPFCEVIHKQVPTCAFEEIAVREGVRTLWQNVPNRDITCQTSFEEIIRVAAAVLD
jgi:hypothetical protein